MKPELSPSDLMYRAEVGRETFIDEAEKQRSAIWIYLRLAHKPGIRR